MHPLLQSHANDSWSHKVTNKANWADNALHFAWPLHKPVCSTKRLVYLATCALPKPSHLEHLRIWDRPLQQVQTSHIYFAVANAIVEDFCTPFSVVWCCFWSGSDTTLASSSLLSGERNLPTMFLLQKLYANEWLNSMLNISNLLWDNSTPTWLR